MQEKFLPVGTVVTLNGGTKPVMIIGYLPMTKENKVFDYSACTYPEGVIAQDKTLGFNHDQIMQVNHMGLITEDSKQFDVQIKSMVANLNNIKNIEFPTTQNNTQQ